MVAKLEPPWRVVAESLMSVFHAGPWTDALACGAQVIPGLLNYGDTPEIGSLIAPRQAVWEVGSRDQLISPKWAEGALARLRRAHAAYGAEDKLLVDRFEGSHQWSGRVAYPLLKKVLG